MNVGGELVKKRKGRNRMPHRCPHAVTRKAYSKGQCAGCYYKDVGQRCAWLCKHSQTRHYSKGLCRNCYMAKYYHDNKDRVAQ